MKVTPLEIRKKSFEKVAFGGYDKDDVHSFLEALSQAWEQAQSKNAELEHKLQQSNAELGRLRDLEASLIQTLKKMDDSSQLHVGQAQKEAQLIIYEAQLKASQILNEAKHKGKVMLQEANQLSYQTLTAMREELRTMDYNYRLLEKQKEMLISEMRSFVNDTLGKIDRIEANTRTVFYEEEIRRANALMGQNNEYIRRHLSDMDTPQNPPKPPKATENPQKKPAQPGTRPEEGSFFDMV